MKTVDDYNFSCKKALIRVDFNVPLNEKFEITDNRRIRVVVPTIKKILNDGGSAILMSHLGRPKNGPDEKFSFKHILNYLSDIFHIKIIFANDCIGEDAVNFSKTLKPGEILLLENLRFYKEEKEGSVVFAQKLAKYGEIYVNDAFGTAHRSHASTYVIAKYFTEKACGYVMQTEINNADKLLKNTKRPFTTIIGGVKISDKILLIENLFNKVDNLIIGGAMSYTFFKALGYNIGNSLVDDDRIDIASSLIKKAKEKNINLLFPADSVIANSFNNDAATGIAKNTDIKKGWMGLDIGPVAIEEFRKIIENSMTILWNGPMGVFEMPNFAKGTKAVAEAIVRATKKGAFSLIGGGDSAAAINKFGLSDKVSHVSTGGGALLKYINGEKLPGLVALE